MVLKSDYIALNQFLKFMNWVASGGEANQVILDGMVEVNGEVELRKRKKLRDGDQIRFEHFHGEIEAKEAK